MGLQHSVGFPLPPLCVDTNCQDKKASLVPSTPQAPISLFLFFFLLSSVHKRGSLTASRPASLQQSEDSWTNIKSSATLQRERGKKASAEPLKKPKFWVGSWRSQNSKTPKLMALVDLFFLLNSSNSLFLSPEPQQSLSSSGLGHPGWELPLLLRENPRFLCFSPQTHRGEKPQEGERNFKLETENTEWKRGEDDKSNRKPLFSMMLKTKIFEILPSEVFESVTINLMNFHRHRGCDPKHS